MKQLAEADPWADFFKQSKVLKRGGAYSPSSS